VPTAKGKQQNAKKGGKDAAAVAATKAASSLLSKKQPKAPPKSLEAVDKLDGGWTQVSPLHTNRRESC